MTAQRLPNFLVVGVPRCGTTSLAAHLAAHPQIFMSREKELHYFDRHLDNGLDWYRDQFADAGAALAVGEATPTYVVQEDAFMRAADLLGDARLVLMVRHPVDRAYSHYWFNRWRDRRDFERAVTDELTGGDGRWGYVADGRYIELIERILGRYETDRLHVVLLDDLRSDPTDAFAQLCRFLDVDEALVPADVGAVHNPAFRFRSRLVLYLLMGTRLWSVAPRLANSIDRLNRAPHRYPPMDDSLRARLLEHYAEPNRRLGEWLGRDLDGWSR